MSALLQCDRITRHLKDEAIEVTLVENVSLTIERGELVAINGASGSGKSSLLYLLGLLDTPTSGTLRLDGVDTSQLTESAKARLRLEKLGFVFQFHFLLPEFTVRDNVLLPMRKRGALTEEAMQRRAAEILEELGIARHLDKKPGQLSGGERQRVAVARALANDPLLILADEPTGNLDSKNAEAVFSLFEHIVRDHGKTVVTVTHDQTLAARCFRQIHLRDGRLVSP